MKLLNGADLVSFIKERQAKQVRMLRQTHGILPKLVIIMPEPASNASETYVRLKQAYAEDILIDVDVKPCQQVDMPTILAEVNADSSVHGIIVQLPLAEPNETESIVNLIAPEKDVDGLGESPHFISATAEAIDWLLAGYGIDLEGKKIALVGQGKLVGKPLFELWNERGLDVTPLDIDSRNTDEVVKASDVVVSAAGAPRIITSGMLKQKAVVVDAGTASEDGVLVGDVAPEVRERQDISITPVRGGVGPLTIALLFDHVIRACLELANQPKS